MTNLAFKLQPAKTILTIEHMASTTPFYYVEEAEIGHSTVSVAFFNENNPDSEIQNETISTKAILAWANSFYRDVVDFYDQTNNIHYQEPAAVIGMEYLKENLNRVLTDYLNNKEA